MLTNNLDGTSLQKIDSEDPFAICISSTMIFSKESLQHMVARIRSTMPESFIIIGGVCIWKDYLLYSSPDNYDDIFDGNGAASSIFSSVNGSGIDANVLVVSPHGAQPLLMVLKELERGPKADFEAIPNLALSDNKGGYIFTSRQDEEVDYNSDYTRWDLLDELPTRIPIRTSIGCPYRCRYCDFCYLYPKIFLRSKESLIAELQTVRKLMKRPLVMHATDDNVFINKKRVRDVCDAIMQSGIKGWLGFMQASSIHESNIDLIKQSGLVLSLIGVESGDQGQIERMNKRVKLEDMKRGIELLDNNGISVTMTFIVGFPGETAETIHNTTAFINHLSVDTSSTNYHVYPLNIC
ncbi:MAG: B12-binding domain-containing radical SAM protein, partial [bacterium]